MDIPEWNSKPSPPAGKGLTEVRLMMDKSREYRERKALRLLMAKLLSAEGCIPDAENSEARIT